MDTLDPLRSVQFSSVQAERALAAAWAWCRLRTFSTMCCWRSTALPCIVVATTFLSLAMLAQTSLTTRESSYRSSSATTTHAAPAPAPAQPNLSACSARDRPAATAEAALVEDAMQLLEASWSSLSGKNANANRALEASGAHLDLSRTPYALYGVKYIDLVSLAHVSGRPTRPSDARWCGWPVRPTWLR